jgi:hypothetical protein
MENTAEHTYVHVQNGQVTRDASDLIKVIPTMACEYCGDGKITGLPGNSCENCMDTGLAHPEFAK